MFPREKRKLAFSRNYIYRVYYSFTGGTGCADTTLDAPIEKRFDIVKRSIIKNDGGKTFNDIIITRYDKLRTKRVSVVKGVPTKTSNTERCASCECYTCNNNSCRIRMCELTPLEELHMCYNFSHTKCKYKE